MRSIEAEARSPEEAIAKALGNLQVDRSQARIEVLDEGSRGFLGVGGKPARVRVTALANGEEGSVEVVRTLLELMNVRFQLEVKQEEESTDIRIDAPEDEGLLIGRRGQTLDAIRHVAQRIVAAKVGRDAIVNIDVGDYRARREDALRQRGLEAAEEALSKGRSITLDPMSAQDRRVIHLALAGREDLHTYTVGSGARRRVVVAPGSKDEHAPEEREYSEASREHEPTYDQAYDDAVPDPGFKPARVVSRSRREGEPPAAGEETARPREEERRPRGRAGAGEGGRESRRGRSSGEGRASRGERPARSEQRSQEGTPRTEEPPADSSPGESRSRESRPRREGRGDREGNGRRDYRGGRREERDHAPREADAESDPGAKELSQAPVIGDDSAEKPFSSSLARQILQLDKDKSASPATKRKTRRR